MLVGLVVNPIAGLGGRVGLKGTDGVVDEALKLGAEPVAPGRAKEFLESLLPLVSSDARKIELVTCPGAMGADYSLEIGIDHRIVDVHIGEQTTADDTKACILALYKAGARLIVFVGGDGTARDIFDAVEENGFNDLMVLGVPSGVKMYSGIFVINPRDAADVIRLVSDGTATTAEFEVMDADEAAFREDRFIIRLYGYLRGPSVPARFQGAKQASPETIDEHEAQEAIAKYVVESMTQDGIYILGPGTTVKNVADMLGVKKTTLGVDVYSGGTIYNDVNEEKIMSIVEDFGNAWIIVSPIGHQGMLFGRGNQQISPKVIRQVDRDRILIMSTPAKLRDIEGGTLKVDTGNTDVDDLLRGYIRVITDYNELRMVEVE